MMPPCVNSTQVVDNIRLIDNIKLSISVSFDIWEFTFDEG